MNLKDYIRDIPDFPKEGIIYKDITTLLNNDKAFKQSVDILAELFSTEKIDCIVGAESRGFIFGSALAYKLGCGFVPIRKAGKLPYDTIQVDCELEYGECTLEIHQDAFAPNSNVLIIDDVLATGGTAKAMVELVERINGDVVGLGFLINLSFLKGEERLKNYKVYSIIEY